MIRKRRKANASEKSVPASARGFFNPVSRLFRHDPNEIGKDGLTQLQRAVNAQDLGKVRSLLKAGCDPDFAGKNLPPLHLAINKNASTVALDLLRSGAKVDVRDSTGQTPLHVAVSHRLDWMTATLLKMKADPNARDNDGRTPVFGAVNEVLMDMLIQSGADINAQDTRGLTVLQHVLYYPPLVEALLKRGADINLPDKAGLTPYVRMIESGFFFSHYTPELQKTVLHKADLAATAAGGQTVLHLAALRGGHDTFSDVLASGVNVASRDDNGNTALHLLMLGTHNAPRVERLLAQAPELVPATNKSGLTPMEVLLRHLPPPTPPGGHDGWIDIARALLHGKADPDSTDDRGRGLLHHAVLHNRPDFIDTLITAGATINRAAQDGKAPLHYAIERHNIRAMDVLLDRGADPDMMDARGWTILDRLAESNDRDSPMVQRLIVAGGQYHKQLPLYPDLMRRRTIDKGQPGGKPSGGAPRPPV